MAEISQFTTAQFVLVGTNTVFCKKVLGKNEFYWYTGRVFDDEGDCKIRVDFLRELLEKVQNSEDLDKSPTNLVVFVTPEFLFRPGSGSYEKNVQMVIDQLTGLVKDEKFKNWVFFFGSIIGDWEGKPDKNIVPIIQGGSDARLIHVAVKRNTSPIDYILDTDVKLGRCPTHTKSKDDLIEDCHCGEWVEDRTTKHGHIQSMTIEDEKGSEEFTNEVKHKANRVKQSNKMEISPRNNFFDYAGISFCVEVCLDHAAISELGHGMARSVLQALRSSDPPNEFPRAQIHVVSSCGMCIGAKSVCASVGGLVAISDGLKAVTAVSEVTENYDEFSEAPLKQLAKIQEDSEGGLPSMEVFDQSVKPPQSVELDQVKVEELYQEQKLFGKRIRADIYPPKNLPTKETSWPL